MVVGKPGGKKATQVVAIGHNCKTRLASPQPASRTPPGALADAAPRRGPALMLGVGDGRPDEHLVEAILLS